MGIPKGMEVQVLDLSSNSEGEVSVHSPDHKCPYWELGPDPNHVGGDTGSSAMDILFEQEGAESLKKRKEKVVEGESAGPPKHRGVFLGAAGRVLGSGSYLSSSLVTKCMAGNDANNRAGCSGSWGDRGDQLTNSAPKAHLGSERKGFHETHVLRGMPQLHSDSAPSRDKWKGILGASHADPVNSLWCSWDTNMKDNEDSSLSWLSKIKGLNFPLTGEHQFPIQMPSRRGLQRNYNYPRVKQREMIMNQIATEGIFTKDMDLQMRLVVLDSLAEAFKNCEDTLSPDSDDDDYEDHIVRDDGIRHRGASDDQINSLPLSLVEGVNCSDESCNICLDYLGGGSIRHLPCLHKFHKECIDRWLRMRICCPICKSKVFSQ